MKSLLLLLAVVPTWLLTFARNTDYHGLQAALLPAALLLMPTANSVGLRGGIGERQPGLEYDTEDPLFDLNVLITGVQWVLCAAPSWFMFMRVKVEGGWVLCERTAGPFFPENGFEKSRVERERVFKTRHPHLGHHNSRLCTEKQSNFAFTMHQCLCHMSSVYCCTIYAACCV